MAPAADAVLVRWLGRAHAITCRLFEAGSTIDEVAQAKGLMPAYVTRRVRLAFPAPRTSSA